MPYERDGRHGGHRRRDGRHRTTWRSASFVGVILTALMLRPARRAPVPGHRGHRSGRHQVVYRVTGELFFASSRRPRSTSSTTPTTPTRSSSTSPTRTSGTPPRSLPWTRRRQVRPSRQARGDRRHERGQQPPAQQPQRASALQPLGRIRGVEVRQADQTLVIVLARAAHSVQSKQLRATGESIGERVGSPAGTGRRVGK